MGKDTEHRFKDLSGDRIKRENKKKYAKHWKNGREQLNTKPY